MKCNFNLFIYHLFLEEWLHFEKKKHQWHTKANGMIAVAITFLYLPIDTVQMFAQLV